MTNREEDPRPAEPRAEDGYEAKYMEGGSALARSRKRMPGWFFGLIGAVALVSAGTNLAAGLYAGLIALPVLALVALLFSHVRAVVTPTHLHVDLGLFGVKLPVGDILSASVQPYDPLKFGGWGIRRAFDGTRAYSTPGGTGLGVLVTYKTSRGRERRTFVSSDNAAELVAAIERARALQRPATRVAVAEEAEAEPLEVEAGTRARTEREPR